MDPKDLAEQMLAFAEPSPMVALGWAMLALCDRVEELSCLVAISHVELEEIGEEIGD